MKKLFNHRHFYRSFAAFLFAMILGAFLIADRVPAQNDVQITGIEVNQVLGVQKDNHQYFVAGKNTVVRAFLATAATIDHDPEETYLQVQRGNQNVFKIYPKKTSGSVSSIDFQCKSMQACGNWAAGSYTFQPFINGTAGNLSAAYEFKAGTKIRVLAVAVKANYGTIGTKSVSGTAWKTMGNFMQTVYPLANDDLVWTARGTALDATGNGYNLQEAEGDGTDNLSKALAKLIPIKCKTSPQGAGCHDFVVGFINESLKQDNGKTLAGYAYPGAKAVVAVAGDDDAPGTVAHELAHQYGIGDTYNDATLSTIRCSVNPAPDGFKGKDWDNTNILVTNCNKGRKACTIVDKDGDKINGAQVEPADHPYEINGRGILPEMADFMSEGGALQSQQWITKDCYDWLFRRLVSQEAGLRAKSPVAAAPVSASATQKRFLSFSGKLSDANVVELNPWTSYTDTATLADTTGSLMARAVNGAGAVVASSSFTVEFFMRHPARTLTKAPFDGVINFPADAVKFQIVKDGAVLTEVPVSTNAPTVTHVAPQTATIIAGSYTATWAGNDPDGNTLFYTVEYNPDITNASSAWMVLADELSTAFWTEDFSLLPGGNHAKIRVTASDGVLSATAESAEFVVPIKKPEIFLETLPWGTVYNPGDDILLVAEGYDPQDGSLPDDKIRWSSDISGELGYGSELIVEHLAAGRHAITVTVTNSAGLSSSATTYVQVGTSGTSTGSGHCFIATAAFGSYLHPYVGMLRDFRNAFLLTNKAGQAFVRWYYRASPPLADWIGKNAYAQATLRVLLLPAVGFSALALNVGLFWSVLILLAFAVATGMVVIKLFRTVRSRC